MRAMVYRRYGGPGVLEPAELPEPKTHVDSVLVRVRAAALNPADLAIQAGAFDGAVETYFPVIPGWDIAGVVERDSLASPEFAAGAEVVGYIRGDVQRTHGGLTELVAADVRTLARKPRTMSFLDAAGLPLAGQTAYQGVVHALDLQPGETLLVHGASGGVGSLAVQIARTRKARVIGTAAPRNHEYLRSLGGSAKQLGERLTEYAKRFGGGSAAERGAAREAVERRMPAGPGWLAELFGPSNGARMCSPSSRPRRMGAGRRAGAGWPCSASPPRTGSCAT